MRYTVFLQFPDDHTEVHVSVDVRDPLRAVESVVDTRGPHRVPGLVAHAVPMVGVHSFVYEDEGERSGLPRTGVRRWFPTERPRDATESDTGKE